MLTKIYVRFVKHSLSSIILIVVFLSLFSCGSNKENSATIPDLKVEAPAVDEVPPPELDGIKTSDNVTEEPVGNIDEVVANEVDHVIYESEESNSMESPPVKTTSGSSGWGTASEPSPSVNKDFKVALLVDSVMYEGKAGSMVVWIGEKGVEIEASQGMAVDTKTIPGSLGRYAKITPVANDFEVKSAKEEDVSVLTTICHKIDPSGSEVRYLITPKEQGSYHVSADVKLFKTKGCTGESISKTAKTLTVKVVVNNDKENALKADEKAAKEKERKGKLDVIEDVFWDKLTIFSTALFALIFGAILFVIRRYIKKKTGFQGGSDNS